MSDRTDQSNDKAARGPTVSDSRSELDELEDRIEQQQERLQREAEGGTEPKFRDSGTIGRDQDDQTIAPPG